mgnify:CR=1 FL=1
MDGDIRFMEKGKQKFGLTVDAVIVKDKKVLLIKRRTYPFQGTWVIPGGYVHFDETLEEACAREAKEETGLEVKIKGIIGAYSKLDRDPRGRQVTVAYLCSASGTPRGNEESSELEFFSKKEIESLEIGFDHSEILECAFSKI